MKLAIILDNERLEHQVHIVKFVLDLLGVDILTVRSKDHSLATTANIECTILIDSTHIAGVQPTILIKHSLSRSLVLIVTLHNLLTLNKDLASNVVLIGRIDLNLAIVSQILTTRLGLKLCWIGCYADKRSTLGHTITHSDGEANLLQECLRLLIHRSTTTYEDAYVTTECSHQLILDNRVEYGIEQRNLYSDAHRTLLEHREYLLAVYLLEYEGYSTDNLGTNALQRLDQNLRGRHLTEQGNVTSGCQRAEEVDSTTISVSQRQERKCAATGVEEGISIGVLSVHYELNICGQVVDCKHYTLRVAGSSRSIVQKRYLIIRNASILNIGYTETVSILCTVMLGNVLHKLLELILL